jgi:cytochrome oxidase Cu insertion factor (SCO1/SenC/PrrC family)
MRFGLAIFCLVLASCAKKPLPVLGEVPAFQLTDQMGRTFSSRPALNGHVWVADFVFTNCEGPCPRMSSHMHSLQAKTDPGVKLISFTVDPARDTPPVLAEYAKKFDCDSNRWLLLTGDVATLNKLDQDAFKLGSVNGGDEIEHSTYFGLVDKKGRIRGFYGISAGDPVANIARDAARLEQEPS